LSGKRVLASGVFDVLHPEHVKYLEEAKRAGGPGSKLVVVLARDRIAERMRGSPPIFNERARLRVIGSLKTVDVAMLGPSSSDLEEGMRRTIRKVNPNIIAFGYDQHRSSIVDKVKKVLAELGKKDIKLVRIKEFAYDDLSRSSAVKRLIARRFSKPGKRTKRRRRP